MRFLRSFALMVSLGLGTSASFAQLLGVVITPDGYAVGDVKSVLATPAVDEVVRISPNRVLMLVCTTTPPAKIIQFEIELTARHKVPRQMARSEKVCPEKGPHAFHQADSNESRRS